MSASPGRTLVVAVSSSALFDLSGADEVFRLHGVERYRAFQREQEKVVLAPGAAFPLVRRLLALNGLLHQAEPSVEVVLLSRNDPDTGLRIMRSLADHRLDMTRAVFVGGRNPFRYAQAIGASLFLSASMSDVRSALCAGVPAGHVRASGARPDGPDAELRIAFDFDGVLADDDSERVFQADGLDAFHRSEAALSDQPLRAGPLARFCRQLSELQGRLRDAGEGQPADLPIRTAIVTSRGAPAHTRVVTTLRSWGIAVDEAFFLGGLPKGPVLTALRPHIFFDDQPGHFEGVAGEVPCAHVPYGALNADATGGPEPTRVSWLH